MASTKCKSRLEASFGLDQLMKSKVADARILRRRAGRPNPWHGGKWGRKVGGQRGMRVRARWTGVGEGGGGGPGPRSGPASRPTAPPASAACEGSPGDGIGWRRWAGRAHFMDFMRRRPAESEWPPECPGPPSPVASLIYRISGPAPTHFVQVSGTWAGEHTPPGPLVGNVRGPGLGEAGPHPPRGPQEGDPGGPRLAGGQEGPAGGEARPLRHQRGHRG